MRGHEFTEENKYFYRKDRNKDFFQCLACVKLSWKTKQDKLNESVWNAYGNKCECCGELNSGFFTIDHIFNDGSIDRKEHGKGKHIYQKLGRMGYPKDRYRLLCFNCNMGRAKNGGVCPHVSGGKQQ